MYNLILFSEDIDTMFLPNVTKGLPNYTCYVPEDTRHIHEDRIHISNNNGWSSRYSELSSQFIVMMIYGTENLKVICAQKKKINK
jgi:hypothetical protein